MLSLVVLCLMTTAVMAQKQNRGGKKNISPEQRAQIEAKHKAMLTKKLELTDAEMASFWPVYEDMRKEMKAVREEFKSYKGDKADRENMTDKDRELQINRRFEAKEKMLAIEKKYTQKFMQILPAEKVMKLKRADKAVKKRMMEKARDNRNNKGTEFHPKQNKQ